MVSHRERKERLGEKPMQEMTILHLRVDLHYCYVLLARLWGINVAIRHIFNLQEV